LEAFLCPELYLLRKDPSCYISLTDPRPAHVSSNLRFHDGALFVHRLACVSNMRNPDIPHDESLFAAQLLDSVAAADPSLVEVSVDLCNWKAVCSSLSLSISPLAVHALSLTFFTALKASDNQSSLAYIISKVIPQRCQGRMLGMGVALTGIGDHLRDILLCFMLGNSPVCDPTSRPTDETRLLLSSHFQSKDSRLVEMIVTQNGPRAALLSYALREHMIHLVEEHPGLLSQLKLEFQFDKFKQIVSEACSALRRFISSMLKSEQSALHRAVVKGEPNSIWSAELTSLTQPYDAAILSVAYKRAKQTFPSFLHSVGTAAFAYDSYDDRSELQRLVTKKEIESIRRLAENVSHYRFGHMCELFDWLPLLGIGQETIHLLWVIMRRYQFGGVSQPRLKKYLLELHRLQPRTFQLLVIFVKLLLDSQHVRLISTLSAETTRFQLQACQERFGTQRLGVILDHTLHYSYCEVCLKEFTPLVDEKSTFKQDYAFGLRDAQFDYKTTLPYCDENQCNYRGACHKQPLKRILLLGNILAVKKRLVTLCPQRGCGRMMVINKGCVITERGVSCFYCTARERSVGLRFRMFVAHYTVWGEPRCCEVCGTLLQKTSDIYCYPFRIYLCRMHSSAQLANHVRSFMRDDSFASASKARMISLLEKEIVRFALQRDEEIRGLRLQNEERIRKVMTLQNSAKH
jgi:hypothetical protein